MRPLTRAQTIHYVPWFVREKSVQSAADDIMVGKYKPYGHYPLWQFDIPIPWDAKGESINWQSVLHGLYIIDPLIFRYEASGDRKYLDRAMDIVRDWHRFHVVEGKEARFSWSDQPTGIRSMKLAWLCSQEAVAVADRELLHHMARDHVTKVLDGTVEFRMTNHGLFQIHGLTCLYHAADLGDLLDETKRFIHEHLTKLIEIQFDHEGIHVEHSPGYHQLVVGQLDFFVRSGLYSSFPEIINVINRAKDNLFWLTAPNGQIWQIGDSHVATLKPDPRKYGPGVVKMRAFDFGYVSIRSDDETESTKASGLFIQGAFHSKIHKHHDDLTFELYEFGQKIIMDSGSFGYENTLRRLYMTSCRAHNTVEIGGRDYNRRNPPYGSAIKLAEERGDHFYVKASAPHPHLGAVHSREYSYWPRSRLRIRDKVQFDGAPEILTQWFHLNPSAEIVQLDDHRITFAIDRMKVVIENEEGHELKVWKGVTEPRWAGWYSAKTGVLVPRFSIGFLAGGDCSITTTISLEK